MSIEQKDVKILDLNLFSGSADKFRTAVGGYFKIEDIDTTTDASGATTEGQEVIFSPFQTELFDNPSMTYVNGAYAGTTADPGIDAGGERMVVTNDVIIPNYKFPICLFQYDNEYIDDNFWKTYLVGGSYGSEEYPGIYNETVWDDYWFETAFPYSQEEANLLVEKESVAHILNISCEYNYYLPRYQEHVASLDSELLIPNMYLIDMFNAVDISSTTDPEGLLTESESVDSRVFDPNVVNFVSLEGVYTTEDDASNPLGNINDLLTDIDTVWGSELPDYVLHGYLSQSVVINELSSSTAEYATNAFQNMFFDEYSIKGGTTIQTFNTIQETKSLFPYYIDISFPSRPAVEAGTGAALELFATSLSENNYSSQFLRLLKEAFNEEIEGLSPETRDYVLSVDYQSSSINSTVDDQIIATNNSSFRSINYLDLLVEGYKNRDVQAGNCYFVGERLIDREVAMNPTGSYRYLRSSDTLNTLEGALEILNKPTIAPDIYNMDGLMNGWRDDGKYNEILAYRIEKIGGPPTGDVKTQNVLQNYWIFNSPDLADINLLDSQVKYGENYTYNIYAYQLSLGIKYKLSDLTISRQINVIEGAAEPYCLEFYNPFTGDTSSKLIIAGLDTDIPDTLDHTPTPAKAELYVTYEPSILLMEVPYGTKTLKVLDNPPNQLSIDPFFVIDESQTLGYETRYNTFVEQSYPKTISSADLTLKDEYLNAKNLLYEDDLFEASVSQQRYLEVYRLAERPTSYTDFDTNLIKTIDLKLKDSTYTLSNTILYDMINVNKKYYYVFRVLSENSMPGWLSEIYEAELINDGGYTYPTFEVLFEEDLQEEKFIAPSLSFKKLIQLQPNIAQVDLNTDDVDYSSTASDQLINMSLGNADELIWDKTFKIRLTSKKTGRKMDLNVTYKYEYDSN